MFGPSDPSAAQPRFPQVTRNSGIYAANTNGGSNGNGGVNVDKAFIQFAGITAGRAL